MGGYGGSLAAFASGDAAFILLKPDALASGIRGTVEQAVSEHRLSETWASEVRLQPSDLVVLWPQFDPVKHPLSTRFFERYLTEEPCVLLVVEGANALRKAQGIKKAIRKRFGDRLLGNLLHVADTETECAIQAARLLRLSGPPYLRAQPDLPLVRWVDFGKQGYDSEAMRDICSMLWDEHAAGVLKPIIKPPLEMGDANYVVMVNDDPESTCESFTYAFMVAFGELSPEGALRLVLTIDAVGQAPLLACGVSDWPQVRSRLRELGVPRTALALSVRTPLQGAGLDRAKGVG